MAKKLNRVLSVILTVMMVLSMVSVFALANDTVTAFAETYSTKYSQKYGKDAVIANTAVLVDNTISADEQAAESFTRTWDGIEFSFVYNVNAFTTLADAYASENFVKDVIVLGIASSTTATLNIDKASRVFSPAWDIAPMNEMTDNFDAIASNGKDWTLNTAYSSKAIEVKNLMYTKTLTGTAEVYGFAVNNVIAWCGGAGNYRTPDVNNPVTVKFINGHYKSVNNAMFYYKYAGGAVNNDTIVVKNVYYDRTCKNFAYSNQGHPLTAANTMFDGLYVDITNFSNGGGHQALTPYVSSDVTVTFKNSNIRGNSTKGFYIASHATQNTGDFDVLLENNVLWYAAGTADLLKPYAPTMTSYKIKNNFINRSLNSGNVFLAYYSATPTKLTDVEISGNVILGLPSGEHMINGNNIDGSLKTHNNYIATGARNTAITPANVGDGSALVSAYANVAGYAPNKTATAAGEYSASSINNFYYDYGMTMSSSAFPLVAGEVELGGVAAAIDNEASTITFAVDTKSVAAADFVNYTQYNNKIKAEVTDQGYTTVKPTVTLKDMVTGQAADAVDTTKAGMYSVTLAFGSFATKQYTVTVGDFSAPYFTDETDGYVGTTNGPDKNSVLVDSSLANEATGSEVIKVWEGNPYTFIVDTNAFASFAAAEAAVGNGGKIIVTNLNGGNIDITKTVSVYATNWNKKPFVVGDAATDAKFDNGTWKATKSDAADWTVNETYSATEVNVGNININQDLAGSVGIYGFTVKSRILLNGSSCRTSDTNTTKVTIANTIIDSSGLDTNGLFNNSGTAAYNNTDTLTFKNVQIKSLAGGRMFGDNKPLPAHMVFDGVWLNFDSANATVLYDQIKTAAVDSSITIKNSNFRKANDRAGYRWQFFQYAPSDNNQVARKLTFENTIAVNITNGSYGGIGLIQNSYSDVTLNGNLFVDTLGNAALFQNDANVARFNSVNMTITNNLLLGYSEPNLTGMSGKIVAEVHDNFFVPTVKTTIADYKAIVGSSAKHPSYTLKEGTPNRHWFNYDMTMSNTALTLDSDSTLTVNGDTISVEKDAVVSKQSIVANAMADAIGNEPVIVVKNFSDQIVDTISTAEATLYTVTLSFENIDSKVYTLNVGNFEAPYFTASAQDGGYVNSTISNKAILLDSSIADLATGSEIIKVWDGRQYRFIVGTNAFANYEAAETAATAEGGSKQIIVTEWNNTAITINKAVNVYSINWQTEPFIRPQAGYVDGKWSAIASDGAAWVENKTTWNNNVKVAGVTINAAISDTVGLYGFEYTNAIDVDGTGRTNYTEKAIRNIVNSKYNSQIKLPINVNYNAGADNCDELNIVNFYAVAQYPTGIFTSEYPAPYTTMDGWMFDVGVLSPKDSATTSNIWFKTFAKNSAVTIKNSYIYGTSEKWKFALSHANQANKNGGERVFTYDNNVLVHSQSTGIFTMEPHDTSALIITNNFVDKSGDTNKNSQTLVNSAVKIGSRLATEGTVTFSGNKILGYQAGFATAITNDFTPEKNFVTTLSGDAAKTAKGIELASPSGKAGEYWLDYNMTISSLCTHETLEDVEGKDKTCTEDGYTAYKKCADCDYIEGKEVIPAGHTLKNVDAKDKTCTEDGYTAHKACEKCDYTEGKETIPAAHTLKDVEGKDKTCTEDGYTAHKACEKCDYTEGKEVILAAHTLIDVPAQEGLCETGGYTAHKACTKCDYTEGKEEIPAGHKYINIDAKDKTCTEDGYTAHQECKNCGDKIGYVVIPASHEFGEYSQTVEATCQSGLKHVSTCANCDATDEIVEGEALPYHKYTNYVHYKDATCTSPAQEKAVCDWCGAAPSIRDVENSGVAPSGHAYGDYVQISAATCVSVAYEKAVCGLCGDENIREVEGSQINPDAHTFGEWQQGDAATCHSNATQTHTCINDGCGYSESQEIADTMVDHSYGEYEISSAATCVSKAYETAKCIYHDGVNCTATDTRIKADSEVDTINGHTYKQPYSNGDATCVTDGTLSKDCRLCGNTFDAGIDVGSHNTAAHKWSEWTYPEATCGSWGVAVHTCTVDGCGATEQGDVANDEPIKIAHKWGAYVYNNDATCYKDGTKTASCTVCGAFDTEKDTDHLKATVRHNWTEWQVVEAATCSKNATITRKCLTDRCYEVQTIEQANSKLPHSYGKYVYNNDATHEKNGTKTAKCLVCGHLNTVEAIGTKVPAGEVVIVNTSKVFTDVKADNWFKSYVDYAYSHKIFTGYTTTTFSPDTNLTRAQIVQIFANLAGIDTTDKNMATMFKDVNPGAWYTPAVKWASEVGIVSGMGNGTFAPEQNVTREQMCVMLVNYIEKCQGKEVKTTNSALVFADDSAISSWAKSAVYKCADAGLVKGVGDRKFAPQSFAARSHAATLFTNFHKEYVAK